jgi:HlyD family secretion protein
MNAPTPASLSAVKQTGDHSPNSTVGRQPSDPLQAVRELEAALAARGRRRWRTLLFWMGGLTLVTTAAIGYRAATTPEPPPRFITAPVEIRNIIETVESSGKLKPLTEVEVGAQVSGRVAKVHVDFNSRVKEGQLLAEIDPSLFGNQVNQVAGALSAAQAQLARAEANRRTAELTLDRARSLRAEAIASQAEFDQAQSALDLAQADVQSASAQIRGLSAQLKSANTTLTYTKIYSPIDGVVINRTASPGQTVAASFAAPVLFVIAQDLSAMQVLADIDEADVGKIAEGMPADVSVDAFLGETFTGRVTQIRYSPNEVAGVVTYAAVVDVPNAELKLRPGMTATVRITTRHVNSVTAIPNTALRFKPKPVPGSAPNTDSTGAPVELLVGHGRVYRPKAGNEPRASSAPEKATAEVLQVRLGVSDGVWTEVSSPDLAQGTLVITRERAPEGDRRRLLGLF